MKKFIPHAFICLLILMSPAAYAQPKKAAKKKKDPIAKADTPVDTAAIAAKWKEKMKKREIALKDSLKEADSAWKEAYKAQIQKKQPLDPQKQVQAAIDSLKRLYAGTYPADTSLRKKVSAMVINLAQSLRLNGDSLQKKVEASFHQFYGVKQNRKNLLNAQRNRLAFDTTDFTPKLTAALFSDIQFLGGNTPNGVAQFDMQYAQPINNRTWQWDNKPFDSSGLYMQFFKNAFIRIVFSKLDSNLKSLPIQYVPIGPDTVRSVNRLDMVQYSNLRIFLQPNLFTITFPNRGRMYADLLLRTYRTQLRDTNASVTQVLTAGYGLSFKYRTKNYFNSLINIEFGLGILRNQLYERGLNLINGPQDLERRSNPAVYRKTEYRTYNSVDVYSFEVRLNLEGKKGTTYFRTVYNSTDFVPFKKPGGMDFNQFFQFQLGTKISLNKVFGIE